MSCDVAALPFQAHANYETWSIDFGTNIIHMGDNNIDTNKYSSAPSKYIYVSICFRTLKKRTGVGRYTIT